MKKTSWILYFLLNDFLYPMMVATYGFCVDTEQVSIEMFLMKLPVAAVALSLSATAPRMLCRWKQKKPGVTKKINTSIDPWFFIIASLLGIAIVVYGWGYFTSILVPHSKTIFAIMAIASMIISAVGIVHWLLIWLFRKSTTS